MKKMRSRKRRSDTKIMTKEARVLKFLRESRGLSIRKAARVIGVSEAIVNHAENGRLDLSSDRIAKFLMGYEYSYEQYIKIVEGESDIPEHILSECIDILKRLKPEKLKTVKTILDSF